ncbi:hypothetical protein POTOM_016586 [Populus tomentosa]|uniref:Endonuclease/exonuclease/phosphatase domain-containing protein n=1 Tax=Populus tomentosa TaxID=118781 RepID=A0A8X7ZT17_POPTO|nr:hypothetical protein POTOM_016586 [Populus tomentosa]
MGTCLLQSSPFLIHHPSLPSNSSLFLSLIPFRFLLRLRIVTNTRISWADLASNSADESTNAGSSANNESVSTAGNAPTRSTYVPPHLGNSAPSSDPPTAAFSGPSSSNDRPGYGGGSRWGVPRNDYRGGYGSGGGRGGWDRGREREVNPFGSDGLLRDWVDSKGLKHQTRDGTHNGNCRDGGDGYSEKLGGFQFSRFKASNKGVTVLKGGSEMGLHQKDFNESDGASVKLDAFQGARASNKGVFVLTGMVLICAGWFGFFWLSDGVSFIGLALDYLTDHRIRKKSLVVATSHLERPCPAPPKWDQMFSKERVDQAKEAINLLKKNSNAKEAINLLKKNSNVIICGDMNWDDKLDGQFPFPDGWVDAWVELKPGDDGWT